MRYEVYSSSTADSALAAEEILSQMTFAPATVLFFSVPEAFAYYTQVLHERFPAAEVFGVTVTTVFTADNLLDGSFVVCAMDDGIECRGGVLEEISRYPDKYAQRVKDCAKRLSGTDHTICMEFTSAFYGCEELVLDTLNKALEEWRIPVAGSSTGIKGIPEQNLVSYNGTVYGEAAVFLLLHNKNGKIKLYSEDFFHPTQNYFYATAVNVRQRRVLEFDERPAADVLTEAFGVGPDELAGKMLVHPLGRESAGKIYLTDGNEILPDKSITFYASIYGNTKMVLMNPGDYRTAMKDTIRQIRAEIPNPRLCMMINCYSRTQLFKKEGFVEEFRDAYKELFGNSFFCFTGFGEQLYQTHLNQTLVTVVFE